MSRIEISNDPNSNEGKFVQQLLDSYFMFRENLPKDGYIQENKTTQQIQDELESMYSVTTGEIVGYMLEHDYSPTTEQDGTVVWAIWRQAEVRGGERYLNTFFYTFLNWRAVRRDDVLPFVFLLSNCFHYFCVSLKYSRNGTSDRHSHRHRRFICKMLPASWDHFND